jgi:hypothetical protein
MGKEAIMIRGTDGCYWLETRDDEGRRRSSYCGYLGSAETVREWCSGKGIEFRQVRAFDGHKGQIAAGRTIR